MIRLGETGGATRRVARLEEFDPAPRALAQRLATKECARLTSASDETVEISHEALLRQWPWLQEVMQRSAEDDDVRRLPRLIDLTRAAAAADDPAERYVSGAELEELKGLATTTSPSSMRSSAFL